MENFTLNLFTEDSLRKLQNGFPKPLRQSPDPNLVHGCPLPKTFLEQFNGQRDGKDKADEKSISYGIPFEEIEEFYENTYIVLGQEKISNRPILYRFNAINKFHPLSPLNRVRLLVTRIYTHWVYRLALQIAIIINFLALGILDVQRNQDRIPVLCVEIGFILIYSFELLVKVLAKGILKEPFTCAWTFWFWFDIFIISSGIAAFVHENPFFKAVTTLRLLKLVPITSNLRQRWNFLLSIFNTLLIVIAPIVIGLCCFSAVIGKQLYSGILTAKCMLDYPAANDGNYGTPESRRHFYNNSKNWLLEDPTRSDSPAVLCGQNLPCPKGYFCMLGFGSNPDNNYTNFDSFSWALLAIIRIVTQDFVEPVFQMIAKVLGPGHVGFFVLLFFVISLPFLSFVIGIIAKYFKEEASQAELELTREEQELPDASSTFRKPFYEYICCDYVFCWRPSKSTQAKGQSIISRPIFEMFITTVLVLDIIVICLREIDFANNIARICEFIYFIEFILRYMAGGGFRGYFAQPGNTLAFIVLPAILVQEFLNLGLLNFYWAPIQISLISFALLRVFRLAYKWNSLGLMFRIMYQSVRDYWYLFTFLLMYLCIFARVGMSMYGEAFLNLARNEDNPDQFDISKLPRWNFTDFMHSFMIIVRLLCGEWIETLWDCLDATSKHNNDIIRNGTDNDNGTDILAGDCYLFYLFALVIGNFLTLSAAIAIVLTTMKTLNYYKANPETKSKVQIICNSLWIPQNSNDEEMIEMDGQCLAEEQKEATKNGSNNIFEGTKGDNSPTETEGYCAKFRTNVKAFRGAKLYRAFVLTLIVLICLSYIPTNDEENFKAYSKFFKMRLILLVIFNCWLMFIEIPTKFIEFGCGGFFTNAGCIFECTILLAAIISGLGAGSALILVIIQYSTAFMLVDRIPRLKTVAGALYAQTRWIRRFVFAGGYIWLIFALYGFIHFAFQFSKCKVTGYDPVEENILRQIRNKNDCLRRNFTWEDGIFNFNNVGEGLQSLATVGMFNGWIEVIYSVVDAAAYNRQPIRDYSYGQVFYILAFILFGIFFTMNIIFGVFVYNLDQKDKRLMFLTDKQKKSYQSKLDKFKNKAAASFVDPTDNSYNTKNSKDIPERNQIPEPTWMLNKWLYSFVTNKRFDVFILIVVFVDLFLAACESFGQNLKELVLIRTGMAIVLTIYTIEMIVKLFAWRCHYFKIRWNIFDFIVVICSIIEIISIEFGIAFVYLSTFRVLRLFRLYRLVNLDLIPRKKDETFLTEAFSFPSTPEKLIIAPLQLENSESAGSKSKMNSFFNRIYAFVSNFRFDAFIMVVILLDCFEIHFNYEYMNQVERTFVLILVPILYYLELILKLIAWRQNYFCNVWNVIDFLAIIGITLRRIFGLGWTSENPYTFFDVLFFLETLRILRILRFIPIWQYGAWQRNYISLIFNHTKLQVLRRAIELSFPSLFNLFCFYCIVFFSYSLYGHILFQNVELRGLLNDSTNFRTFWKSFFTLIQISMISGVDGAYKAIANTSTCSERTCGNPFYAKLYLITYVGFNTIIFLNVYLTLIMETINQISVFDKEVESVRILADKRGEILRLARADTMTAKAAKSLQYKFPSILKKFKFTTGTASGNQVIVETSSVASTYKETDKSYQAGSNDTMVGSTEEINLGPESGEKLALA